MMRIGLLIGEKIPRTKNHLVKVQNIVTKDLVIIGLIAFRGMMNKYPIIIIPGTVISKKRRYKIRKIGGHHSIYLDIKKSVLDGIIKEMRRQWGLPTITTAVQVKLTMYVPSYPLKQKTDHDNAKQLYLDLLQADKWKTHRTGQNRGLKYLASEGAGVIIDDKIVQSTDGTRFIFMCFSCQWGFTGERNQFTRKKVKMGCPGVKSCPEQRIEIEISDMEMENGIYTTNNRGRPVPEGDSPAKNRGYLTTTK